MIFVHGYQGSDYDLEKARNYLNLYNGTCYGLLVKSIQNDMDENIEKLGEKLASEIKMHINNSLNSYKKINFIGYSLGGVIIREALKYLE
jgi:triacylglycerol esterase/lipase EstA (alpha/beta hydrolase family)